MTESNPPPDEPSENVTELINLIAAGDEAAAHKIVPVIYDELRRIAAAKRRQAGSGETLRTTALVHEAYLRVVDREPDGWPTRGHFFFAAARAMRDILVEDARKRAAAKHGGGLERVTLDEAGLALETEPEHVLSIDRCLKRLEREDELGHRIVLFRFFVGLTMPEIADALSTPLRTIERKWTFVRAWLAQELATP